MKIKYLDLKKHFIHHLNNLFVLKLILALSSKILMSMLVSFFQSVHFNVVGKKNEFLGFIL